MPGHLPGHLNDKGVRETNMDQPTTDAERAAMVRDAKARIAEISPRDAIARRQRGDDVVYLDVREPNEWNLFHIPGAVHVPLAQVASRVGEAIDRDADVIVYCAGGDRSALATDAMRTMGYARVASLSDGVRGWMYAGGELQEEDE